MCRVGRNLELKSDLALAIILDHNDGWVARHSISFGTPRRHVRATDAAVAATCDAMVLQASDDWELRLRRL